MKILREYGINGDKKIRYNLVEGSGSNLSDMVGQRIQVKAYVIIETDTADGDIPVKALKILDDEGNILGTRSASLISGLERFLDCMESDALTDFEITKQRSKAGRDYLTFKA